MKDQHDWRSRAGTLFKLEKQSATGSRGVVAANNPIGSAAGVEMLAIGGNALDAAIATLFTLNVVRTTDGRCPGGGMDKHSPCGWNSDHYRQLLDGTRCRNTPHVQTHLRYVA